MRASGSLPRQRGKGGRKAAMRRATDTTADPVKDAEDSLPPAACPPGLDPRLTGGVTFAGTGRGPTALVRSEEELRTIRYIVMREESLRTLRNKLRRVEARFEVTPELLDLLLVVRNVTGKACDCIGDWKRQFAKPRPFTWNGMNYLVTVSSSMDFLDRMSKLITWFGFHLNRNPFLVPAAGTPMAMIPPAARDHVGKADMVQVRELEEMVVEEERMCGIVSTDEHCSWCSVQTARKGRAMCVQCREFYCWHCIRANLNEDQVELAQKSTKWTCFVCTWDERQAAIDQCLKEARWKARKEAAQAKLDEEVAAQMAERGKFDALDAILRPDPPKKVKRKPKPKPVVDLGEEEAVDSGVNVLLLPNANPKEFFKAFRVREPIASGQSKKLRSIALRLHRPRTVWWPYMENAVGHGPADGYVTPRAVTPPEVVARRKAAEAERQLQELLVQLAAAKKGPREHWQVRLLRTLPPDRSGDLRYGKGTTWEEERERRQRERKIQLTLYLEDRTPRMLIEDKVYPPAERPPPVVKEPERFTLNMVRRMGLNNMRVLLTIRYTEPEVKLPSKYAENWEELSIWGIYQGSIGGNRTTKADDAVLEFDDDALYDEHGYAEPDGEVVQVMREIMDVVAPLTQADEAAVEFVEDLLDNWARESYPEESWRVASAMVDHLVDLATTGYHRGSGAVWEIRASNPRTSTQWKLDVPTLLVKTEADHFYRKAWVPPGWLRDADLQASIQVSLEKERAALVKAEARRTALAFAHGVAISDDEESDDGDDDGVVALEDMLPAERLVTEILRDVVESVDAVCTSRAQGGILAEDLARQAKVILSRIQLLPEGFPFTKRGPLELRLGLTHAEGCDMMAKWEAPREMAERAAMAGAEAYERAYMKDLADEEARRAENERLMALADFEMREFVRLEALAKWQAEHPLEFHESQISRETGHTDTLELNLTQTEALTGGFKEHKGTVAAQKHAVTITIPKALRPLLRTTLTPGALTRIARGRGDEAPKHLWEAPPPPPSPKKAKKKRKKRK